MCAKLTRSPSVRLVHEAGARSAAVLRILLNVLPVGGEPMPRCCSERTRRGVCKLHAHLQVHWQCINDIMPLSMRNSYLAAIALQSLSEGHGMSNVFFTNSNAVGGCGVRLTTRWCVPLQQYVCAPSPRIRYSYMHITLCELEDVWFTGQELYTQWLAVVYRETRIIWPGFYTTSSIVPICKFLA